MKFKKALCAILAVALVFIAVYFAVPQLRVRIFVERYDESIEHGYETQSGLPGGMVFTTSNIWSSDEHDMLELILFKYGDTSYGCYYSPDDVPLPFQNMSIELLNDGHYYWKWDESSEDTNYGKTSRIKDKWYYFEVDLNTRKTDNKHYFKDIIENQGFDVSEDVKYYPEILSECTEPENVLLNIQSDSIEYSYEGIIKSENGFEYEDLTVSIQSQISDTSQFIEKYVDDSNEKGMNAVCYNHNGTSCAFIYDERADLDKTIVNVLYLLSDNVTVFYATRTNNLTEINDETIDKICSDFESVSL